MVCSAENSELGRIADVVFDPPLVGVGFKTHVDVIGGSEATVLPDGTVSLKDPTASARFRGIKMTREDGGLRLTYRASDSDGGSVALSEFLSCIPVR